MGRVCHFGDQSRSRRIERLVAGRLAGSEHRASRTRSSGIVLPQKETTFRPFIVLTTSPHSALNVVVFNPPPVPAGAAPITIRVVISRSDALETAPMGIVLKPTVVIAAMVAIAVVLGAIFIAKAQSNANNIPDNVQTPAPAAAAATETLQHHSHSAPVTRHLLSAQKYSRNTSLPADTCWPPSAQSSQAVSVCCGDVP